MKSFLRAMLIIFGIIVVFAVATGLLLLTDTVSLSGIQKILNYIISYRLLYVVTIVTLIVIGLLAIISIANSGALTSDIKGGIILPLKIGEVHISNQTFESIAENVAKKYAGIKTARVSIRTRETGLAVDLFAYVLQDTVISDITEKVQEDIKATVLKQTTVVVETVNVKIKGVYTLNENKEA